MRKLRSLRLSAVAVAFIMAITVLFTGSSTSFAAGSTINVCGDLSLSGVYSQIGSNDNNGSIAYFKWVDKNGGIDGHPVKYTYYDNQSSASQSELIARKCVEQDHATWIFGPESGANTESALPIAIANKVILLSMSSGWQTNGYPSNELTSYGFPVIEDVFKQDDVNMAQQIISPRHYTRAALIEDNCGSVCLANKATMQQLAKQYHFTLTTTQIVALNATDMTPQVLAMLATKPQVIIFGLVPGVDTYTAIKAIRAQNPTIPIGECSGCYQPSFVAAAGGAKGMKNVYSLGSTTNDFKLAEQQASNNPVAKATAAGFKTYFQGMKVAGFNSPETVSASTEGWDAGLEMTWAINHAKSTDVSADQKAMQHLNTNTLGIVWDRTPQNYLNIKTVYAAMQVINPNGTFSLYNG